MKSSLSQNTFNLTIIILLTTFVVIAGCNKNPKGSSVGSKSGRVDSVEELESQPVSFENWPDCILPIHEEWLIVEQSATGDSNTELKTSVRIEDTKLSKYLS